MFRAIALTLRRGMHLQPLTSFIQKLLRQTAPFYIRVGSENSSNSRQCLSVTLLADSVSVPSRDFHDKVLGTVGNGLTGKSAVGRQARGAQELVLLTVAHVRSAVKALADNNMAGRAGTYPAAGVVDVDTVCERDIQNAPRQAVYTIGNLFRIHVHGDIHWLECDLERFRRWFRNVAGEVRIRATHENHYNCRMARLPYVELETASSEQKEILEKVTQKSGKIANFWKLWGHSPQLLEAFLPFNKALAKGTLDPKLRELAYVKASQINDCAYCANAHKSGGLRVGVTEQQLQELGNYATSSAFSELEKLVLRYTEELTRTAKSSEEMMAGLKKHLSPRDIVELSVTVGLANLTNRFNMSLLTDLD